MTHAEWGAFLIGSIGVAGFFWLVRSDKLPTALRIFASLCVAGTMAIGIWLLTVHSNGLQKSPHVNKPSSTSRPQTSIGQIFPPQSTIDIRPIPGTPNFTFFLSDWVSWSASEVHLSSWISENRNFVRVSSKQYPYIGAGDQATVTEPIPSSSRSVVAVCMSYVVRGHRVEVIQFFSNPDGSGYRRARDNVSQVDGDGHLCEAMPRPALEALRQ
jgi:hypothetical protein